ncbi:MAG: chromosome segregation protein SMC, partial [Erysipelotrichaceae bacterium]
KGSITEYRLTIARTQPLVDAKKASYDSLKDEYDSIAPKDEKMDKDAKVDELIVQLTKAEKEKDVIVATISTKRNERVTAGNELERKNNALREARRDSNTISKDQKDNEIEKARVSTKLENEMERLASNYEMTFEFASTKKIEMDMEQARIDVIRLRNEISALGNVNLEAPEEYEGVRERYETLCSQRDELISAKNKILEAISEMDDIMIVQFKEMFDKINNELHEVFRQIFGGGRAELKLLDPNDILNTGIEIDVQPPGKDVKNNKALSGGEKSLVAICVLFSILKARTIPLCIFDEVEAALDQANVEKLAKYIGSFKGDSQFIVVTHRPGTMEQCDSLYGVTMQEGGVSQLFNVKLNEAISLATAKEEE